MTMHFQTGDPPPQYRNVYEVPYWQQQYWPQYWPSYPTVQYVYPEPVVAEVAEYKKPLVEYRVVNDYDNVEGYLNMLARQGWYMVTVSNGRIFLEREVREEEENVIREEDEAEDVASNIE